MGVQKNEWIDNMKQIDGENIHLILNIVQNLFLTTISGSILEKTCVNFQIIGVSYALSIDGN